MEEEGLRKFQELRAKFQKFDAPPPPGPTKFPASVLQKNDRRCTWSTQILASGKPLSSNPNLPSPSSSSGASHSLKTQKMQLTWRSEIQKSSRFPEHPGKSAVCLAENAQAASMLLDVCQLSTEPSDEEKGTVSDSFRDKLWNWEKVSSQKSKMSSVLPLTNWGSKAFHLEGQKSKGLAPEKPRKKLAATGAQTLPSQGPLMTQRKSLSTSEDPPSLLPQHGWRSRENPSAERSPVGSPCQPVYEGELPSPTSEKQADVRHQQHPKTKPLPSIQCLGPPPPKPSKPPIVNLQAFRRQPSTIAKTPKEVTGKESHLPPESAEFEEPHNYEATISYLRHSDNSINLCTTEEIADSTYEVGIEELQKPWKSFLHGELCPRHENEEKNRKEKGPCELEPQNPEKDSHSNHPLKVSVPEGTPGKVQMTGVHQEKTMPAGKQEAMTDIIQIKVCPEDIQPARHSADKGGYVEALEMTKETPDPGGCRSKSLSEETYDDVECPRADGPKLDFSSSFASDSEENSEEMYEDIYKTKSNAQETDLDGKEALKRLQQFFRKEKGRFKMKKTKSKENVSAFSISLPDLELKSQEVIIYDDVDMNEKESKYEEKAKTWKPRFLIPKGKKEKKGAEGSESFSPRNFFRTKKQNLEKNRMEREEKLFRERFQYDKEIVVINRAVACSNNSRNGTFDLPITPGEEVEIIDTTEQNLVICRNAKGKYGYVLIEHLHFTHQGWSH